MWTLWLVTFATGFGTGGSVAVPAPTLTPLAIYQSEIECENAVRATAKSLTLLYPTATGPEPGTFMCVPGSPPRR